MLVKALDTALPEVLRIEPGIHRDPRGFFLETFNSTDFAAATGLDVSFVQDNHSRSSRGVLRGIHYQVPPYAQGKLVRCASGRVFDVAVDLRRDSPTFGIWVSTILDDENHHQIWVPPGFGHGFVVLSDTTDVCYKTTTHYHGESERVIRWDDPALGIEWPEVEDPVLSHRDQDAPLLSEAEVM